MGMLRKLQLLGVGASVFVIGFSAIASIAASKSFTQEKYLEFGNGWYVGVRTSNWVEITWLTGTNTHYCFGKFPDAGQTLNPSLDLLVSPYRWPDIHEWRVGIMWVAAASSILPAIALIQRLRKSKRRGFAVEAI